MQRSSSFVNENTAASQKPKSRIPTPSTLRMNLQAVNGSFSPTEPLSGPSTLRRSSSLRLPRSSSAPQTPVQKEVWGIGTGSWGKRQQIRRQQGLDVKSRSTVTSPVSPRGFPSLPLDRLSLRGSLALDDDDDLCSERSYDSTMSVDRVSSRRRYVVHCGAGKSYNTPETNGASYLTPTQRATQLNKELKSRLRQALDEIAVKEHEISRLTQECVELRMNHVRNKQSSSPEPILSRTPSYVEKDSLNSSVHSNCEYPVPMDNSLILSDKPTTKDSNSRVSCTEFQEAATNTREGITESVIVEKDCNAIGNSEDSITRLPQPSTEVESSSFNICKRYHDGCVTEESRAESANQCDACTQTTLEIAALEEQLAAAKEALIETKGAQQRRSLLLSAEEAVLLWQQASLQVQLSRAKATAGTSHAEVTLQFLKSAFFHLVTGSGQTPSVATKSHWRAIQSILGFTVEECRAMDNALTAGTFPGGTW